MLISFPSICGESGFPVSIFPSSLVPTPSSSDTCAASSSAAPVSTMVGGVLGGLAALVFAKEDTGGGEVGVLDSELLRLLLSEIFSLPLSLVG